MKSVKIIYVLIFVLSLIGIFTSWRNDTVLMISYVLVSFVYGYLLNKEIKSKFKI